MGNEYLPSYGQVREALDEIPVAVRAARRMRGLTLKAAAAEAGADQSTLWRIEQGASYDRDTLRKVLAWLDAQKATTETGADQ